MISRIRLGRLSAGKDGNCLDIINVNDVPRNMFSTPGSSGRQTHFLTTRFRNMIFPFSYPLAGESYDVDTKRRVNMERDVLMMSLRYESLFCTVSYEIIVDILLTKKHPLRTTSKYRLHCV